MKASIHPLFNGFIALVILGAASLLHADPGDPGRSITLNNTLYAADGKMLRGDHVDVAWSSNALKPATWSANTDIWFNCRRLDGNKPVTGNPGICDNGCGYPNTDPYLWQCIDSCVNMAARAGQYVLLLYGASYYGQAHIKEFWTLAAPRYKNRTHVIFEIANEPGDAWKADIGLECAHIARAAAPQSHIVLCSIMDGNSYSAGYYTQFESLYNAKYPSEPWNWSTSTIGVHSYRGVNTFGTLKTGVHSLFDTESFVNGYLEIAMQDKAKVAWNYYDGKRPYDITPLKNYMLQNNAAWWLNPAGTDRPEIERRIAGSAIRISHDLHGAHRVELTGNGLHQITLCRTSGEIVCRAQSMGPGYASLPSGVSGIYLLSIRGADVQTTRVAF